MDNGNFNQKQKENFEAKQRVLEITIREHGDQERVLITSHQKIIQEIKKDIGRAREIGKKDVLAVDENQSYHYYSMLAI